jgi:ABC-2 type transport system permease protein
VFLAADHLQPGAAALGRGPRRSAKTGHHRWTLITGLVAANLVAGNLWLQPIGGLRADLTEGSLYTISDATRNYLGQLQEPLLIRGYFSAETHPLLAPLVPQLRDLLREYRWPAAARCRWSSSTRQQSPELEREAGEQYGIRPVAFQTESKYQSSVVNSYFDILVKYGDQYETLGFQDLIEVKAQRRDRPGRAPAQPRVRPDPHHQEGALRLPGRRRCLQRHRRAGPLRGFISPPATLPEPLPALRTELESVLSELQANSDGRFDWEIQDPATDPDLANEIGERFGFQPLVIGLLDPRPSISIWCLEHGEQAVPVPLPESLDRAGLERAIEAGIKRFAPGVLRTVALFTPSPAPAGFMACAGPAVRATPCCRTACARASRCARPT